MDHTKIIDMPGYELSKAIHNKDVSCVEVMDAFSDQIDKVNPGVNAIVSRVDKDNLKAQAKNRDDELAKGVDHGWMHGFPQAVKDLALTKDIPTTFASPIFKDNIPAADEVMVDRMKKKGSIIVGKTNTPEFGYGSQTYNTVFGTTGNPYDHGKTCGGSSGGAACSLAMRMQAVADGSDYMGSLRNPAGWCNVFGYRPSINCLPYVGAEVFTSSMLTNGPMARTVADVALLLGTQAGFDELAPLSKKIDPRLAELTPENVFEKLEKDVKGTKIAWLGDWDGYLPMEDGILDTVEKTLGIFPEFGANVEKIKPFYDPQEFWEKVWLPIRHYSACSLKVHIDAGKRDMLKPEAQWEFDGSAKMSAQDVYNAFVGRTSFFNAMMKVYDDYDYIIVPSAQLFAFDNTVHWPKEVAGRPMKTYHNYMEVVTHWTMGGNAIISAPAGFGGKDDMPIGMQIIAKPGHDFDLLQFAKVYEAATGFVDKRRPVY